MKGTFSAICDYCGIDEFMLNACWNVDSRKLLHYSMDRDESPSLDRDLEEKVLAEPRGPWKPRISQAELDVIDAKFGFARMTADSASRTGWLLNMKAVCRSR